MKNLSKVMAVVLAFLMTISSVSFAAFTDVAENASYGEAVSVLNALGILKGDTDGAFRPDDTIKRSEFAAVVCRLLGLGEAGEGAKGQVVFADVAGEHWASGYIALASQQGIVNGKGNGIFDPDADVKYEEAVKMIVAALGYTPMADTNGGYPGGYQIVAAQKGILAGVKGIQGQAASRSLVAQMCYNALEVPLMVQDGFGTEISFGYGNELLLNKLNITKIEGTVYATSASDDDIEEDEVKVRYDRQVTAFSGQATAARQDVYKASENSQINCNPSLNDVIKVEGKNAFATIYVDEKEGLADEVKDLLDLKVVMYVLDADTEDATLVAIAPKGTNNDIVEFRTEDINDKKTGIDSQTTVEKVVVEVDADETFDLNISKIYINGREKVAYAFDDVTAGSATKDNATKILKHYLKSSVAADVKLLNNDSRSDKYNIIYITAYKDYVVDQISAKNYAITSKGNEKVIFDEENKDYRFEIVKDGEKVTFADIQVNDVISLAGAFSTEKGKTKEVAYGKATITSQQVAGKVKSYSKENGTITIDDQVYNYDSNKVKVGDEVKLGDEVTMYLNARNVLVGVDKTQSKTNLKYGFATVLVKTTDVSDEVKIRLMDTEGTWKTVVFASTVYVDGTKETTSKVADWTAKVGKVGDDATASTTDGKTTIVNKVVGYEVNGEGEINKIYFNDTKDVYESKDLTKTTAAKYTAATEDFGSVLVNDATVIFSVPDFAPVESSKLVRVDEDDVSLAKIDALVDGDEYADVTAINVDDDDYAAVLAGTGLVGSVNKAGSFFTIASKTLTTNDEGEEGVLLTGIRAGVQAFLQENLSQATQQKCLLKQWTST